MKYEMIYKDKDSVGKVTLNIPSNNLSTSEYARRMQNFLQILDKFNTHFSKQKITVYRRITQ